MDLQEQSSRESQATAHVPRDGREDTTRELRESRDMLAGIINSAMDAIITVDSKQNITIFNAAAEKMFRCKAADVIGQSLDRFIPRHYREAHRRHVVAFGQTGVTNRTMGHLQPLSGVRADGEEFPLRLLFRRRQWKAKDVHGDPPGHFGAERVKPTFTG